ncbi:hypothetical protein CC2G_002032 [Coprinopsis cinerea AmutBmut pab1-1]|nr:hypothetical protein CC2G_002032 [Coprinopsis cinerea AmutBmut pab1-1]
MGWGRNVFREVEGGGMGVGSRPSGVASGAKDEKGKEEKGKEGDAKGKGKAKEVEGMGESGMEEVRIHFAGLLPGLARWSQLALRVYLMSLLIRYWRRMKSRFFRRLCLGGLRMPLGMS